MPITGGLIGSLWYIQCQSIYSWQSAVCNKQTTNVMYQLKLKEIQVILIVVTIIILTETTTIQRIYYIVLIH